MKPTIAEAHRELAGLRCDLERLERSMKARPTCAPEIVDHAPEPPPSVVYDPAADSDVWADPTCEDTQPTLPLDQVRAALERTRHDDQALAEIDKNAPAVRYPLPPDRETASAWVLARYLVRLLVWRWRARWERRADRTPPRVLPWPKPPTTRPSK